MYEVPISDMHVVVLSTKNPICTLIILACAPPETSLLSIIVPSLVVVLKKSRVDPVATFSQLPTVGFLSVDI